MQHLPTGEYELFLWRNKFPPTREAVRSLRHPSSPTHPFWGQRCPESWKPCPGALGGQDPAEEQPCSPRARLGCSPAGCAILLWIGLGVWFGARDQTWFLRVTAPLWNPGRWGSTAVRSSRWPERGGASWWREGRGLRSDGPGRLAPGPSSSPSLAIARPPVVCLLSLSHLPLLSLAKPSLPWYRLKEA